MKTGVEIIEGKNHVIQVLGRVTGTQMIDRDQLPKVHMTKYNKYIVQIYKAAFKHY